METGEAPQSTTCGSQKPKRARLEVFSAVLESKDLLCHQKYGYKDLFGVVLIRSCNRNFPIFESSPRGPPQISPEGRLPLTALKHSIPVEGKASILPWFVDLLVCSMDQSEHNLWDADDGMNQLICQTIHCFLQFDLHVSFAVYHDPIEAYFDVSILDLEYEEEEDAPIQVHGTVTASNNFLLDSEAKSTLLHCGGGVSLKAGKSVPLSLSRRMTVVPRQSTLIVDVSLQVRMGHLDLSFEEKVKFNRSSGYAEESFICPGCANRGKLLVKVTWAECEGHLE